MMVAGENFKKIHRGGGTEDDEFPIENKLRELSTKCRKLESFSFDGCGPVPWMRRFGNRMKSLAVHSMVRREYMLAAASYSTNLRELSLDSVPSSCINGSNMWKNIGNTLERLRVHFFGLPHFLADGEVRKIQKHCRQLKDIDIRLPWVPRSSGPGLASCLASYGGQLVEKCVNARAQRPGHLSSFETAWETTEIGVVYGI